MNGKPAQPNDPEAQCRALAESTNDLVYFATGVKLAFARSGADTRHLCPALRTLQVLAPERKRAALGGSDRIYAATRVGEKDAAAIREFFEA